MTSFIKPFMAYFGSSPPKTDQVPAFSSDPPDSSQRQLAMESSQIFPEPSTPSKSSKKHKRSREDALDSSVGHLQDEEQQLKKKQKKERKRGQKKAARESSKVDGEVAPPNELIEETSFLSVETPHPSKAFAVPNKISKSLGSGKSSKEKSFNTKTATEQRTVGKRVAETFKYPEGYNCTENSDGSKSFACPVVNCDKVYSRKDSVTAHIRTAHTERGQVLGDNGRGGFEVTDYRAKGLTEAEGNVTAPAATRRASESHIPVPSSASRKFHHVAIPAGQESTDSEHPTSTKDADASENTSQRQQSDPISPTLDRTLSSTIVPAPKWNAVPKLAAKLADHAEIAAQKRRAGRPVGSKTVNRKKSPEDLRADERSLPSGQPLALRTDKDLENWELADGKVVRRLGDSSTTQTIAYSGTHVSKHLTGVQIASSNFAVYTLPAGESHSFIASPGVIRQCPVSQGRVHVQYTDTSTAFSPDETTDFSICENGIFVVRPGSNCTVTNRSYAPAVLFAFTSVAGAGTTDLET